MFKNGLLSKVFIVIFLTLFTASFSYAAEGEDNDNNHQLTLIESENIDFYNKNSDQEISYIHFRRNIITKGIELNALIGKELQIGSTKIKVHKLCEPCLELQNKLQQTNFVKNLTHRGGLRCEILTSGLITVNDDIVLIN